MSSWDIMFEFAGDRQYLEICSYEDMDSASISWITKSGTIRHLFKFFFEKVLFSSRLNFKLVVTFAAI